MSTILRWRAPQTVVTLWLALAVVVNASDSSDTDALYYQRMPILAEAYPVSGSIQLETWIDDSKGDGTYSGVDYTTGCAGRTANWPAEIHWINTVSLASAYIDAYAHNASLTGAAPYDFAWNATVKDVIDSAMGHWFDNDFTDLDCLDKGGVAGHNCPCGTPGLWNPNWFSNVIYIPRPATQTCLLLNSTITDNQRASCVLMGQRSYDTFDRYGVGDTSQVSWMKGANILDIASIGVNVGILRYYGGEADAGLQVITEAYGHAHDEIVVQTEPFADGIRPDGSFGQHVGVLYNGNYGKDYTNLILSLELSAAGTQWEGDNTTRSAFELLVDGSQWMMYRNTITDVLHWDISTIGRMITFPVADGQASASINVNVTQIEELGNEWDSTDMATTATNLASGGTGANAGDLIGNRMFWVQDYMVHRGSSYVTTVKMLSHRTRNSECINAQNPFGFHLGQGASYTYVTGNEYEDIAHAWDWSLVPGITTDYQGTGLECATVGQIGKKSFVGGASNGNIGVAAMNYQNPLTGALTYQKAWFFFEDDVQHVTVSGVAAQNTAPIYTVLDQKRSNGPVYVDGVKIPSHNGTNKSGATSLWHSQIGYTFNNTSTDGDSHQLAVTVASRSGNWSAVGVSTVPGATVELFSATLQHPASNLSAPLAYSIYPATDSYATFKTKTEQRSVSTIRNDAEAAAVLDDQKGVVMVVLWTSGGGTVDFPSLSVTSDQAGIVIFDYITGELTFADPTQALNNATVTIMRTGEGDPSTHTANLGLPQWETAGQSVTVTVEGYLAGLGPSDNAAVLGSGNSTVVAAIGSSSTHTAYFTITNIFMIIFASFGILYLT
ncbi:hypothetical protein FRB95_011977 [Tulasnella sp. JGI-2019a]|nr:hypothetical protein FRB95_011977 [Tulasnella sp. JGI-2019a]